MGKDKGKWSNADFKRIQRQIKESSLRDHAEWVERCADDMQTANDVGNTRGLYNLVKTLSEKVDKKPEIDLNEDSQGNVISNASDRAAVLWYQFLKSKFAATAEEHARPSMEQLGRREATDVLTKCEVAKAVANLKNNKAVGADGIPVEVYKVSASAFNLLHKLLARVWKEEQVPEDLGVAVFKMLYKRKGSPNDPSKYRCIGLLNSAYKVLSAVMLNRITRETAGYLQDWQAGFRQNRGCRDNVMILRTAINKRLKEGKSMILTFIDYSAAFDSVGHKFLDEALGEASAKPKTRAIFRSVYGSATARTKVKGTDGEDVLSDKFPIRRGVIQGDLTSPIYFIIALEAILRRHDKVDGKGIDFGGVRLHTLGYADDAALIDECPHRSSERVTRIALGSKKDADMQINISKTECMHVKRQQSVHTPNIAEAKKVCKHVCKNIGCGWVFGNKHGLKIHQGKWCKYANYYSVEKLLDVDTNDLPVGIGPTKFLVKWEGYGHRDNTWEPYENITKAAITEFLQNNGKYDYRWQHRCPRCDKPCRSARGVQVHYARKCRKYDKAQRFEGTIAKQKHTVAVLAERQKQEEKVICEGTPLKNCFNFKYLGSMFTADGTEDADLARRIGMATTRCGQLRFVLGADNIKMSTKMKIYKCAMGSLFTYGSEAWNLSAAALRKLNGANAGCLFRFTGKTRVEESRPTSCTYSLTTDIRRRRAIWLGHILRMQEGRLVRIAAKIQHDMREGGNLFMDAPSHQDYDDLVKQASCRLTWKSHINKRFGARPKRKRKRQPGIKSQHNFYIS